MRAVLAVLANPLVKQAVGGALNKLFNRKGKNGPVDPKVSGAVASGSIITVVLMVIRLVDPGLADVLTAADAAVVSAGVITLVTAVIGYFQPKE